MKIYIAADHRGFKLKQQLASYLTSLKHQSIDVGSQSYDSQDDYPDVIYQLAKTLLGQPGARAVAICGSGIGVSIASNRYAHLRCGLCHHIEQVRSARAHNDINILGMGADFTSFNNAKKMVSVFLDTPFNANLKYKRRIDKTNSHIQGFI